METIEVPFPAPREAIRDATHFRSTWVAASQQTLRDRKHFDRYRAFLPDARRDEILALVAGMWLPMETARVHYEACDRLGLDSHELLEIGRESTRRANDTVLALVVRLSRGAGATPWTVLTQVQKLWDRTCEGGGVGVFRLGPKEARVEVVGYPLADLTYNRVTFRGILSGICERFCAKLYVAEVPRLCLAKQLAFRLSWA